VHHALAKQYLLERRHELAGHAYLRAVDCYLKRGDHAGAAEAYEELTGCYPECLLNLRNQFGVALALEQQGHFSRAAHAFQQLVDAYPKSQEAQVSLMRAATLCLDRLADLPAALACLDRLIAQYPHGQWHDMARRQRDHVGRMLGQ
jgi:TolA-binding protein